MNNLKLKITKIKNDINKNNADKDLVNLFYNEILPLIEEYDEKMEGAIIWSKENFIERGKQLNIEVDEDGAREMLRLMIANHDCSIGINWETVDSYLSNYKVD